MAKEVEYFADRGELNIWHPGHCPSGPIYLLFIIIIIT